MQNAALIHPHAAPLATDAAVAATAPIRATHVVPLERVPVAGTAVETMGTVLQLGASAVKGATTVMLDTSAKFTMGMKCVVLRLDASVPMGRAVWEIRSMLDPVPLRRRRHLCPLLLLRQELILMSQLRLQAIRIPMTAMSMIIITLLTIGE